MPIAAEYRHLYGREWSKLAASVKTEARWRCETCAVEHGDWRERKNQQLPPYQRGQFHTVFNGVWFYRVVLTVAHLDHQPENMARDNLRALCQRCHLAHDAPEHLRRAAATRAAKNAAAHNRAGQLNLI